MNILMNYSFLISVHLIQFCNQLPPKLKFRVIMGIWATPSFPYYLIRPPMQSTILSYVHMSRSKEFKKLHKFDPILKLVS